MVDNEVDKKQENRKNTVMNFVNGNLMKGTERRLTMVGHEEMSKENKLKLKESYKHPFDRIPKNYFTFGAQFSGDQNTEGLRSRRHTKVPETLDLDQIDQL